MAGRRQALGRRPADRQYIGIMNAQAPSPDGHCAHCEERSDEAMTAPAGRALLHRNVEVEDITPIGDAKESRKELSTAKSNPCRGLSRTGRRARQDRFVTPRLPIRA